MLLTYVVAPADTVRVGTRKDLYALMTDDISIFTRARGCRFVRPAGSLGGGWLLGLATW